MRSYFARHPLVTLAFFLALLGVAVALGLTSLADAQRSHETQTHGVPAIGVVMGSRGTVSCERRYHCHHETSVRLSLTTPVRGVAVTTAHIRHRDAVTRGERLRVLVDPHQPSWSELPGQPFKSWGWPVFFAVVVLLFLLVIGLQVYGMTRGGRARSGLAGQ